MLRYLLPDGRRVKSLREVELEVSYNAGSFADAACGASVSDGDPDDLLSCLFLKFPNALHGYSVKCGFFSGFTHDRVFH